MGAPTKEQKAKEAAVLYTSLADLAIITLLAIFALATLSLTLISEAMRAGLMLVIELYAFFVLRAVHRDRLKKLRFGIGKIEQMCNLVIGAALLLSGFLVADHIIESLLFPSSPPTPLGIATAAAINAINLLINALGWLAMVAAARHDDSAIYRAQLRARFVKLVSSAIVQITITIAAVAEDPVVSIWLDGVGATFVAGIMVTIGIKMLIECLPDLLDNPVPEATKRAIDAGLQSAGIVSEELVRIRTRRAGSLPQVELTLAPTASVSLEDYSRRAAHVEAWLQDHLRGADVSVVVDIDET